MEKHEIVVFLLAITVIVALVIGGVFLSGLIIWALWNALVPSLADGPAITYWQGVLISLALGVVSSVFSRRS